MSLASAVSVGARPSTTPERTASAPARDAWGMAGLLAVPAVALMVRLLTGPHPIDDAFITFRYARNLAEGTGLVYNAGEWVLGTTAPLWAVILAAGYKLGLTDLPWLATAISAVCDAASALLVTLLARKLGWPSPAAALVGTAWALNPMSVAFAAGGMETSAFILLMLVALTLATASERQPLAGLLAGLGTLLRPESALLAATVVACAWLTHARAWRWTVLSAVAPIGLAGGALMAWYGSPLPHSVAAKQVAYAPVAPIENVLALLLQAGLPGSSTLLASVLPTSVAVVLSACGALALAMLARSATRYLDRRTGAWQPFAIFGVLFLTFYLMLGVRGVRLFPWYLVPITPLYLLAAATGLKRHGARAPWLPALLLVWQLPAIDWHQPFLPSGENLERERLFYAAGEELRATLLPTATVAAPEIGALGYASHLRILDTVGLVSPSALGYYPLARDELVSDNAIPTGLIASEQPDAVVALDAYVQRTLLQDARFARQYEVVQRVPAHIWQSQELVVFRRATRK